MSEKRKKQARGGKVSCTHSTLTYTQKLDLKELRVDTSNTVLLLLMPDCRHLTALRLNFPLIPLFTTLNSSANWTSLYHSKLSLSSGMSHHTARSYLVSVPVSQFISSRTYSVHGCVSFLFFGPGLIFCCPCLSGFVFCFVLYCLLFLIVRPLSGVSG